MHVPTFFGDSNDWDLFYELFTELIQLKKDLSPFLKFNNLKTSLKGEARNEGSGRNYVNAWEFLSKKNMFRPVKRPS